MNQFIDLHTHILPGMDDGAKDAAMSIEMLKAEAEQGVGTVVLTPHFYPQMESDDSFLSRRQAAYETLSEQIEKLPKSEREQLPKLVLGAEVAWYPSLLHMDLHRLCIGESDNMLLELPQTMWKQKLIHEIYNLQMRNMVTPVFAHLERYLFNSKSMLRQIYEMELPIQLSSEPFGHLLQRGQLLSMIRHGNGQLIGSDCHNLTSRKPNIKKAMQVIEKTLGSHVVDNLCYSAQRIIEEK